jgi:hypothetical protein
MLGTSGDPHDPGTIRTAQVPILSDPRRVATNAGTPGLPCWDLPKNDFQVVRTLKVKVLLARHLHPRDLLVTSFTVTDDVHRTVVRVLPLVKAVDMSHFAPLDDYISTRLSPLRQVCDGCGHLKTGQHA